MRRLGGRLKRPAEMLAGVTQADARPIVGEHLLVERSDERALRFERRWRLAATADKRAADLSGQPRTALRGAADHHRVGARGGERGTRLLDAPDVAIDHDRDFDGLLDGTHGGPVGAPFVELAARTAVHGDEAHAGGLGAARELGRVE